jgi:hypothetical protein
VDQRSRICRCAAALRLTQAIQILLRHLITTSAARVFTVCSVVALMSVQSRHTRATRWVRGVVPLQHHAKLPSEADEVGKVGDHAFMRNSDALFCFR